MTERLYVILNANLPDLKNNCTNFATKEMKKGKGLIRLLLADVKELQETADTKSNEVDISIEYAKFEYHLLLNKKLFSQG